MLRSEHSNSSFFLSVFLWGKKDCDSCGSAVRSEECYFTMRFYNKLTIVIKKKNMPLLMLR